MKKLIKTAASALLTLAMVVMAALVLQHLWRDYMQAPWTRDAHVGVDVVQAAIDLARVSVAAQVAGSDVEICNANHELQVAEHSLQLQQHSRQITQRLIAAGRGTPPDLARATAQVTMLEASLPPLRARRQAAGYRLAALLGKTPGDVPAGVDSCAQAPALQQPIPIGDGRAAGVSPGCAPGRAPACRCHRAHRRGRRRVVSGYPPGRFGRRHPACWPTSASRPRMRGRSAR